MVSTYAARRRPTSVVLSAGPRFRRRPLEPADFVVGGQPRGSISETMVSDCISDHGWEIVFTSQSRTKYRPLGLTDARGDFLGIGGVAAWRPVHGNGGGVIRRCCHCTRNNPTAPAERCSHSGAHIWIDMYW